MGGQSRAAKRREKQRQKRTKSEEVDSVGEEASEGPHTASQSSRGVQKEANSSGSKKRDLLGSDSEDGEDLFVTKKAKNESSPPSAHPTPPPSGPADAAEAGMGMMDDEVEVPRLRRIKVKDLTKLSKVRYVDDVVKDESIQSSGERARELLSWVIAPLSPDEFFARHFEGQPLLIERNSIASDWYQGLLSTEEIKQTIKHQRMVQGEELTFTQYDGTVRNNLHEDGSPVTVAQLNKHLENGASLRLLCPQKFSHTIWGLLSGMEENFGAMVGSNAYLTPSTTQGFAPHYDDIEAFILQLEGEKRWRVYGFDQEGPLPRFPSDDFDQSQLPPLLCDTVLKPGDMLYLPRGIVHQGETVSDVPSLHLTLSTGQTNAWADFMELIVPQAVGAAIQEVPSLRQSLPPTYLDYVGATHSDVPDDDDERRPAFRDRLRVHMTQIVERALDMMDAAADQMAKKYISDRLPPLLTPVEESHTAEGCPPSRKVGPLSKVRLIRKDIARLVLEDGVAVLYHSADNSLVHHGAPLNPLEFPLEDTLAIDALLTAYPHPILVKDLPHPPHEDLETKVTIVQSLFKEGIVFLEDDE